MHELTPLDRGITLVVRRLEAKRRADRRRADEENCTKEIDGAHETANRDQADYDRQLLTISVGFLGISVAFVKDIVPLEEAILRPLLYASFGLLTATVCLVLLSYQFSIAGQLKAKKFWEAKKEDPDTDRKFPYGHALWIRILNVVTGILFAAGLTGTVTFVVVNMNNEAKMKMMRVQEGALMKNPTPNDDLSKGQGIKAPPRPQPSRTPPPTPPKK